MKALFVSYPYPPYDSIAAVWASKMTKYLLALGWDVRVLTTDRDKMRADLPIEIPSGRIARAPFADVNALPRALLGRARTEARDLQVARLGTASRMIGELYRSIVNFPDAQIGWYPNAVKLGLRLLRDRRPDVIVSSSPYPTSHLVAHTLSQRSRVPWLAEYRDPWTGWRRSRFRAWPLSAFERALERRIVADAAGIVTVSQGWAERYRRSFPSIPVHFLPNGFDSDDYGPRRAIASSGALTLVYTGGFHRGDPRPLFRAVSALVRRGVLDADGVRIRFIGPHPGAAIQAMKETGLAESVVEVLGPVSQREALAAQTSAHVLVLFLENDPGWRPAKLYEYLGAHRPILVLGGTDKHEAARVVEKARAGSICSSIDDIERRLADWNRELRTTGCVRYEGNPQDVARYERRNLAAELDRILRTTIVDHQRSGRSRWTTEPRLRAAEVGGSLTA